MAGERRRTTAADGTDPGSDGERWRALVDRALGGADFARLVRPTADGIAVRPLHTEEDAGHLRRAAGLPGEPPYVRGAAPVGASVGGWDIRQPHAHPDPAAANAGILGDLQGGVTSIQLRLDRALARGAAAPDGVVAHDGAALGRALEGVRLDLAPIGLDAGARFAQAARQFLDLCRARGHAPSALVADLNADPLGAAVAGEPIDPGAGLTEAAALAAEAAGAWPGVATCVADGRPYHAGGASEAQELACAVATGIAELRALEAAGLDPVAGARQVGLAVAADADVFLTIAKLRALRQLWGRVLRVAGAEAAMPGLRLRAETATRMLARRDPHVNLLRGTAAAFAAGVGGASSVTVLPFDHALGPPDAFARRLARNTQLILIEESHLGRAVDPAGGSWFVESLTRALAEKAWAIVREIERRGGMAAALAEGYPQDLVAWSWRERERAVATRREPVVGVSEFPQLDEAPRRPAAPDVAGVTAAARAVPGGAGIRPIAPHRLGEAFEALRDRGDAALAERGARPRVFLCNLGRPAGFAARAAFARDLFAAGGFAAVESPPLASAEQVAPAFRASGARLAAICAADEDLATPLADGAARALKEVPGARRVYLMGRPEERRRAALAAAGVDEFLHAGGDALATLERAQALALDEAA